MIPDINLIPKLEKEQTSSKYVYIILGVVSLLALAFFVWQYFSASSNITSLQTEETALIQQRDQLQTKLSGLNSKQQISIGEIVEKVDLVSYPVLPLINEIEGLQTNNSYLREYSFEMDTVTITMDFETLSDISKYLTRLTNSAYFIDVQITNITQFELGNETETNVKNEFLVIPRHTANITLFIEEMYLAMGGAR